MRVRIIKKLIKRDNRVQNVIFDCARAGKLSSNPYTHEEREEFGYLGPAHLLHRAYCQVPRRWMKHLDIGFLL